MKSVDVELLKDKLSEYVRLAAAGEIVLVADCDRVAAKLGPPDRGPSVSNAVLLDAARQGWIKPPLSVVRRMLERR